MTAATSAGITAGRGGKCCTTPTTLPPPRQRSPKSCRLVRPVASLRGHASAVRTGVSLVRTVLRKGGWCVQAGEAGAVRPATTSPLAALALAGRAHRIPRAVAGAAHRAHQPGHAQLLAVPVQ